MLQKQLLRVIKKSSTRSSTLIGFEDQRTKFPHNQCHADNKIYSAGSIVLEQYHIMLICSNIFDYQVAVNIFDGIQDKDARYLAEKLEFKGPLLEQVRWLK